MVYLAVSWKMRNFVHYFRVENQIKSKYSYGIQLQRH